jgi:molecular chaperone DnaK
VLTERNTTIPSTKKETFSTADDNQTAVTVRVFQGERKMASDNRLLGQFNLEGIPPAPRGMPQIEVAFDIDVNGILNVSAKDVKSGKEQSVKIEDSSGLSEDEIEQIRKDAESHAEEDKQKRELAEARNQGNTLAHEAEKALKEHAEKIDEGSKTAIESAVKKVQEAVAGEDVDLIKSTTEELSTSMQAMAQHVYAQDEQAAPEGAETAGATADQGGDDDDVIDAEFEKKE